MDLHEYDNCNGNLKLANDTYPLVGAALDKLQVKNKGTMDNTELASMKTTKTELNFRITNCINGLGQWKKANPGLRDPPGITAHTGQAGDNSTRDTQTGTEKRMSAINNYEKCTSCTRTS